MKCNLKTMLKTAALLATALAIGYWAVPGYRATILGLIPVAAVLICPLSMLVMMWLMQRRDDPHNRSDPPAKQDGPLPNQHTR
ncbi:DUF2933 domain-containing protein (plasmid) [Burkholderia thailandensis]|uniref:DUF2933 domain-containing protein n=1 Tax=Burkholderia thailandensis TaxID=57975 RepID=UPI00192D6664|nr:DUF2933 domain-containing protein [Burkholderia thailandensis]MBS2132243.1 DUF2933 domain-containing protein [Burkholderia thailandensis]QRA15335.1 DUF2933 domain-containing protein [Burkholderia thailandensis]